MVQKDLKNVILMLPIFINGVCGPNSQGRRGKRFAQAGAKAVYTAVRCMWITDDKDYTSS